MSDTQTLHSVHTFMLPMRWDYLPKGFDPLVSGKGNIPFDERTELQQFLNLLTPAATATTNHWKRQFYRIDNTISNYNELVYYHAHAANNFFDLQREDELDEFTVSSNKSILYFELLGINPDNDRYIINVAKDSTGNANSYALRLSGICLHVFTTGVAILSYTLQNKDYPNQEDILYINEFGRRIYPPYITTTNGLSGTKENLLAASIQLTINAPVGEALFVTEDYDRYNNLAANNVETHKHENGNYYNTVIDFPSYVKKLFPADKFVFTAKEEKSDGEKISFRLLTSDRMFFQCWYGNNNLATAVGAEMNLANGSPSFAFAQSPFWYAFLYGDKKISSSIANKYLMEEQLLENTYARWASYGTIYGFSKDSFVCVSSDMETLTANHVPDLSVHMQTMYYQMAVLCLAQRASVLRFSGEVATLADLGKQSAENTSNRIQQLNLNYIEFINKIYYREITPEIQGIEIYQHFQKAMNIERDVHDLQAEISELHNFAMMKKQEEQASSQAWLNTLAMFFLPASIILSFLGIGYIKAESEFVWFGNPGANIWNVILLLVVTIGLTVLLHKLKIFNRKKQ